MRVVIATDVFPPRCGGAGWSTYFLARALRARGHTIAVVRPRVDAAAPGLGRRRTAYDGFPVVEVVVPEPPGRLARLWMRQVRAPRALRAAVAAEARRLAADVIHAQHAQTVPAAVGAAARLRRAGRRVPVVATVRDYWPLAYYSTMQVPAAHPAVPPVDGPPPDAAPAAPIGGPGLPALARALWRARGPRALRTAPLWPLWEAATAARRRALRACAAVIAVSGFVAEALARGGAVRPGRLTVIPNLVDLPYVDAVRATPPPLAALGLAPGAPFLLFAGKLEPSKGPQFLPWALRAAGVGPGLPLVLAGSGPLRPALAAAGAAAGLDLRFADWLDNADLLRLLGAATLLLFPSGWDEPLSRVLLEACAVGAPIVALATGGTGDILTDGANARLVDDLPAFAAAVRDLLADPAERARLVAAARATAEARFSAPVVAPQVEALYARVVAEAAR